MGLFAALSSPLRAFSLIRRTPELWRLSLVAAALCAVAYLGLVVALFAYTPALLGLMWAKPVSLWLVWLWYVAAVTLFAVAFVIGAQTLPVILLSPLGDRLSIATERTQRQAASGNAVAEIVRSVYKAILRVALLIGGQLFLLPLWLVPGAGHAAWTVLSAGWSMLWLSFEYVDLTANRHGMGFRAVVSVLGRNLFGTLGLGAALYVLLFVPFVNVFFFPVAVVSGTLFFLERD
jgi:CysZ protein